MCFCLQDECSFVSLRDVERAMLAFTYFFDKIDLLREPINRKEVAIKESDKATCQTVSL